MIELTPLFADIDIGDLIKVGIFIFIIAAGAIGHLMTKMKETQEAARRRQQRAQAQAQAQAGGKKDGLEDEIGAFLRGAAERRGAGGAQPARPAPQQPRPAAPAPRPLARPAARPAPQQRPVRRPARPMRPPPVEEPVDVVQAEAPQPATPLREQRGEDRLRHLAPADVGQEVSQADDKMEERVHEVFDHKLGQLAGKRGDTARPAPIQEASSPQDQVSPLPSTAAAGMVALFANTNNLRQAILIHEILRRPEERWNL
jgi:hypothetical protein